MSKLTIQQRARFADLEARIRDNEKHVLVYLESLKAIRDEKLYADDYATFGEYCERRWDKSHRRISQLITHVEIIKQLEPPKPASIAPADPAAIILLPQNESQTRQLNKIPEDRRLEVWQESVKVADGSAPAGAIIKRVWDRLSGKPEPTPRGKNKHEPTPASEEKATETEPVAATATVEGEAAVIVRKDDVGNDVPDRILAAFETADQIECICRELSGMARLVSGIAAGPGGRLINVATMQQLFRDARGHLAANRATHLCPYCQAKKPDCECCKGEGWVAKHIYSQAPQGN